jgi:hypothetical protein
MCITIIFNRLPEADLNPDEEKQDVSYLTGDFYHYVVYISYDGYIWELDCWKIYPLRHDAVPKNGNWITILKKMLKVEIGVNSFNTTFLTVMEDPKVDLRNKYSVIHSFHKRITDQLARNGGTVLSQLHLNRVQTSLISYLGNKIDTDLREATLELLNEYKLGSKNEETHQAPPTQAKQVRRAGKRKVKTIRRAGKGRGKNIRFRGKGGSQAGRGATGRGQSGAASTTTSRKRQRDTGDDTDEKRKQSVRNVYSL